MEENRAEEYRVLLKAYDEASMSAKRYLLGIAEGIVAAQALKE